MLDDMLEKNREIVRASCLNLTDPTKTEGGIKLFKKAPPSIKMDSKGVWSSLLLSTAMTYLFLQRKHRRDQWLDWKREKPQQRQKPRGRKKGCRNRRRLRGEKWLLSIARQMKEEKARERRSDMYHVNGAAYSDLSRTFPRAAMLYPTSPLQIVIGSTWMNR
ncbi:uncharacterized protein LOC133910934 [Phragmites australis]|uniref:uncharacterized protein LOC133910934 n=1 Tax=Phragmites australis TaxID=29695 RepID=UPI002D76DED1|nr:uncharacterized protein LOC133910934 [Phragmites australis]